MGAADRKAPRYARQLDVNVNGLEIVTTNVAVGGVQISCPEMRFAGLEAANAGGHLHLHIRLPGTRTWLGITGSVRYCDPCGDEYLIGVQFESFHDGDGARWFDYITALADSRTVA